MVRKTRTSARRELSPTTVKIKFQAAADLNEDIVSGVLRRMPQIDVQRGRRTMPAHFGTFIRTRSSSGVFIISQRAGVIRAIDDLVLIWSVSAAEVCRLDPHTASVGHSPKCGS